MSGTAGTAPPTVVLGLDLDLRGAVQTSRALVQSYLLSTTGSSSSTSAGHPLPHRAGRTPLKLPSLVTKRPCRRSSMARLSLSEPSLLTPHDTVHYDGSSIRLSTVKKKQSPPPPPFSKSSALFKPRTSQHHLQQQNQNQLQSCCRPNFIHFSHAIQPSSKPRPARRHSHNPVLTAEMVPSNQSPHRYSSSLAEPLSVIGKPCLPSSGQRPAVAAATAIAGPARPQLHVFLPTEAEAEEVDQESVDEGFMDELDCKISCLKLQPGTPKTLTYH
ncbi:uncharacterized protein V6R79_006787 [Siganus canaliculatus]